MFKIGDVIQFTENHKWAGAFGFISKVRPSSEDIKYLIGVPMPDQGIAYIFSYESKNEFEKVGEAILMPVSDEED